MLASASVSTSGVMSAKQVIDSTREQPSNAFSPINSRRLPKSILAAVREALSGPQGDKVTREDVQRIKQTRRAEIALSDMEPLKMEQFEFFIIPDSKQAKVEPLAVGYYDPDRGKMEVAAWDEVKLMLKTG